MKSQDRIAEALATLCGGGMSRQLLLGDGVRHDHSGAQVQPYARMMAILEGSQQVEISVGGRAREVRLDSGNVLYLAPHAWFCPAYDVDYVIFGLVFRADRLRLLINDHLTALGHRSPRCWLHFQPPSRASLAHTVEALNALAEENPDSASGPPLLSALLHVSAEALSHPAAAGGGGSRQTFDTILDYLQVHLQEPIDRNLVAQVFRLHPGHVSRLFQQHGAEHFNATLNRLRLERAAELLRTTGLPVKTVAEECGYTSSVHFIRRFRRHFGVTPGDREFRDRGR